MTAPIHAVFFDLDGTLVDSAPDLAAALNAVRRERGLDDLPLSALRPYTSQGGRGLLREGLGVLPDMPDYPALLERFLQHYAAALCIHSRLFDGVADLLATLDERGLVWGIITNKAERFTLPLVAALGLQERAAAVVGGDTCARAKPAPDPLLHACSRAGVEPQHCLYVGDDPRDIEAGRAAGMRTIAVTWGYHAGVTTPIEAWQADWIHHHPHDILHCLIPH